MKDESNMQKTDSWMSTVDASHILRISPSKITRAIKDNLISWRPDPFDKRLKLVNVDEIREKMNIE